MSDPVVVVGASLAATRFVRFARRAGLESPIVVVGDEPHLPYDRPPLSKGLLTGAVDDAGVPLRHPEDDATQWRLGVRATALDLTGRRVSLDDGTDLVAEHVVVATGATARHLPGTEHLDGVHVLRTLDDGLALRDAVADAEHVAVVGAGFIGCEVAASARTVGREVTVVDPLAAPVVRGLGARLGGVVGDLHRDHGVNLRLGVGVDEVLAEAGRARGLRLSDGSTVEADVVVVGIGALPATDWLEGSGLTLDDGVVCGPDLAAVGGGGHVWAMGDVCRWTDVDSGATVRAEHWTNANDQGRALAHNLVGTDGAGPYRSVPYVWSDQYDAKLQVVGEPAAGDDLVDLVGDLTGTRHGVVGSFRDGRLVGVVGIGEARATMGLQRLVGEAATREEVEDHLAGSAT